MYPKLKDLHNPNNIVAFTHKSGVWYVKEDNQAFQEYPKCIELWQEMDGGRIMRVHRWHKKSVMFFLHKRLKK